MSFKKRSSENENLVTINTDTGEFKAVDIGLTKIHVKVEGTDISASCDVKVVEKNQDFVIENGVLKKYLGSQANVKIPSNVTAIGERAFEGSKNLIIVTIPEGVSNIQEFSFYNCSNLIKVSLPDSMISIADSAFVYREEAENADVINSDTILYGNYDKKPTYVSTYADRLGFRFVSNYVDYDEFSINDTWRMGNNSAFFSKDADYKIPLERYIELFGKSVVKKKPVRTWIGNCFGMSATAIKFYNNELDKSSYATYTKYLNDIANDHLNGVFDFEKYSNIVSLIERFQIYQDSSEFKDLQKEKLNEYKRNNKIGVNVKLTYNALNEAVFTNDPMMISLANYEAEKPESHMVALLTNKKIENIGNGWHRIFVYDCNAPFNRYSTLSNEDYFIELNPDKNQWRAWINGKICGSKENGEASKKDTLIYYNIDEIPTTFDGSLKFTPGKNSGGFYVSINSAKTEVYDSGGEIIYGNGDVYSENEEVIFMPEMGSNEGLSGTLYLPNGEYNINGAQNEEITVLCADEILSFKNDKGLPISIDTTDNPKIYLKNNEPSSFDVSLTTIKDKDNYLSVDVENIVKADQSVGLFLEGDVLNISSSDIEQKVTLNITDSNGNHIQISDHTIVDLDKVDMSQAINDGGLQKVKTVKANPDSCSFSNNQLDITLSSDTEGASIFYSIDGSDPLKDGNKYINQIKVSSTTTIKTIAVKDGMKDSEIATFIYTKQSSSGGDTESKEHAIKIDTLANGKIEANTYSASKDTMIYLTVLPNIGYRLKENTLKYNKAQLTGNRFMMPDEDVLIYAEFEKLPEDDNDKPSGGGSGGGSNTSSTTIKKPQILESLNGKVIISADGKTVTIIPNNGYAIQDVLINGKSVGMVTSYNFGKVDDKSSIKVIFEKIEMPNQVIDKNISKTAANKFTDINNHWAKENIKFVLEKGLFAGMSEIKFYPDMPMTRGMFVAVLGRLAEAETNEKSNFSDVEQSQYYAPYVAWAQKAGITSGISNTEFAPDKEISREELAVMICQYSKYKNNQYTPKEVLTFSDETAISDWARDAVAFVQQYGLMSGMPDKSFQPKGKATRAEVATILV